MAAKKVVGESQPPRRTLTGLCTAGGTGGNGQGGGLYNVATESLEHAKITGNQAIGGTGGTGASAGKGVGSADPQPRRPLGGRHTEVCLLHLALHHGQM
jgi:hypothetical protein